MILLSIELAQTITRDRELEIRADARLRPARLATPKARKRRPLLRGFRSHRVRPAV
jgi:hypothetical protein